MPSLTQNMTEKFRRRREYPKMSKTLFSRPVGEAVRHKKKSAPITILKKVFSFSFSFFFWGEICSHIKFCFLTCLDRRHAPLSGL